MFNQFIFVGRVTKKPEMTEANGMKYALLNIAVRREFKGKQSLNYETDFYSIYIWFGLADKICSTIKKGDVVFVKGRIQTSKFTNKDGQEQTSVDFYGERIVGIYSKTENEVTEPEELETENID